MNSVSNAEEINQLRSQIAALEQLLEVHERTTIEQSERLEAVLQDLREHTRRVERSEERYALVTRATKDVIWDWDLVTDELLWNEALEPTFGYSPEQVPREIDFWIEHVHPEDRERVSQGIHAVIDGGGTTWTDEYRFLRADGSQATVFDRGFIARDESGKPTRMIGSMQDITKRKHTEQVLRENERRLEEQNYLVRTITDNATAGMFMMDEKGRPTFMNPAAEAMIGYTLDEIRDMPLHDAIHHTHPDGTPYPMSECPIDRALPENNNMRAHEDIFVRKDGTFFPVTVAARPILQEGQPVGTVVEVRDVTDEKRAEGAIRWSERRFRSLVQATSAIVWNTTASGEFGGEQPGWGAFTGQTQGEYEGWSWLSAIHPEDRTHTAEAWKQALETRTMYATEHRVRRHDGEYRHMLVRAVPILDQNERIGEWIGVHTDITERKEIEERQRFLAETGAMLASSLDYTTTLASVARFAVPTLADWCAIDIVGDDGAVQRVEVAHPDPAKRELALEMERRYPADPDAPTGVPQVLRTGEPEMASEIPEELLEVAARDEEHLRMLRELGLRSYIVVPMIARGRTLGAITLISAESGRRYGSTELETARELALRSAFAVDNARLFTGLERLIRELDLQRARLADLFKNAPAFIAVLQGPNHVFEIANPPYLQLVGNRSVVGRPVVEALPEVVEQGFVSLLDQVYTSGEPFIGNELRVFLQRTPQATPEEVFVNFVYQPVREADGSVGGIFVHGVEVTEQVRARQEIERKAEELVRTARALEATNRELDQFAYVASHDLKAPLRGIANLSQWIEEDIADALSEENREQMNLLRGRVHRMEGLIEGILQYSRAGRMSGKPELVDTGVLVREVTELLDPPDNFAIEVAADMPTLQTERLPLQQVFLNLISNAIKYTDRPDARVEVAARDVGDYWDFSVTDNGPGIAPEYHDRIFAIFQRLEARDTVEGTGIGLSLVKKIVEGRHGRVWVESQEGHGTTFRFTWLKVPEKDVQS